LRPNDAEVLRRIAKQYAQMISDTPDRKEKIRLGRTSLEYAQRAVTADPNNSDARLSLAICYGRVAFFEPPKTRIEYSKKIEAEAREATRLNPRNDYAWHVLGRWNHELASFNFALKALVEAIYGRFPDASFEQAAEYFEKAIAVGPPRVVHHVELGRTYAALGRKEDARAQLQKGLSLPSREKDDDETKARARKALAEL
jgi:tetratricopeptide (TPR) repeat protein